MRQKEGENLERAIVGIERAAGAIQLLERKSCGMDAVGRSKKKKEEKGG